MAEETKKKKVPRSAAARQSLASRADIYFPARRICHRMKGSRKRVPEHVAVYLAAALESLSGEFLETAARETITAKMSRITSRLLAGAIYKDKDLQHVLANGTISSSDYHGLPIATKTQKNAKMTDQEIIDDNLAATKRRKKHAKAGEKTE